jgi:hypothetical protein
MHTRPHCTVNMEQVYAYFIMTFYAVKDGNCRLTKLTKISISEKWLSDISRFLQISFVAKDVERKEILRTREFKVCE